MLLLALYCNVNDSMNTKTKQRLVDITQYDFSREVGHNVELSATSKVTALQLHQISLYQ